MKKIILYLIFVLFMLSLSSCYSVEETPPTFFDVIGLPESKFNSALELKTIENFTILACGETVDLDAVNNTNTLIQLVLDTNVKIFKLNSDSEWIEIENKLNYAGRIVNIPTKESDPLGEGSFWLGVRPDNCEPSAQLS